MMRLPEIACVSMALLCGLAVAAMAQAPSGAPLMIKLPARVTSVALSANSNVAAIASADKNLTVWDLSNGKLLSAIPLREEVDSMAISADGRWICSGDHSGNATIWDVGSRKAHLEMKLAHYLSGAAFSYDGKLLAIAPASDPLQVFDLADSRKLFETGMVVGGTESLAFSRDGAALATADADTAVRIYDAHTGKLLAENRDFLLEPLGIDFTSDGKQVIALGGDKILTFIDVGSGKTMRRLPKIEQPVFFSGLKVSRDGALFATVLMKAENMEQPAPIAIWNVASGAKKTEWMPPTLAFGADWAANGQLIAFGGSGDSVQFWRIR
jgi:WD40 repeat protein